MSKHSSSPSSSNPWIWCHSDHSEAMTFQVYRRFPVNLPCKRFQSTFGMILSFLSICQKQNLTNSLRTNPSMVAALCKIPCNLGCFSSGKNARDDLDAFPLRPLRIWTATSPATAWHTWICRPNKKGSAKPNHLMRNLHTCRCNIKSIIQYLYRTIILFYNL